MKFSLLTVLLCATLFTTAIAANYPMQFKSALKMSVGTTITVSTSEKPQLLEEAQDAIAQSIDKHVPGEFGEEMKKVNRKLLSDAFSGNVADEQKPEAKPDVTVSVSTAVARNGQWYYDYINKKARFDLSEVDIEIKTGVSPTIKTKWMGSGGYMIMRYDQNYNFTGGQWLNGTDFCYTRQMNSTMMPLFVPPAATKSATTKVYVSPDGTSHTVDVYTIALERGAVDFVKAKTGIDISFSIEFYVDTSGTVPLVLRMYAGTTVDIGAFAGVQLGVTYEAYNYVVGQPVMSIFEPSTKNCTVVTIPRPQTVASLASSAPACPNTSPPKGCQCATKAIMPFCGAYTSIYPLDGAIDPAVWDTEAKNIYNAMARVVRYGGGTIDSTCSTAIKQFYCAYVFPRCTAGGILYFPVYNAGTLGACGSVIREIATGIAPNSDGTRPTQSEEAGWKFRRLLAGTDPGLATSTEADNQKASSPFQAYRTPYDGGALPAGAVAGIVIAVLGIAVIAGVFGYYKKNGMLPFSKGNSEASAKPMKDAASNEEASAPYVEFGGNA